MLTVRHQVYRRRAPYPDVYYRPDIIEAKDIWETKVCQFSKVLIIGDSIIKYVTDLNNTQVIAYRGITIEQLAVRFIQNKIPHILNKELVITHVGTNNIGPDTAQDLVSKTCFLVDSIRDKVPNARILISLILPRPITPEASATDVKEYNFNIMNLASQLQVSTIPSYRNFLYDSCPIIDLFAGDKLHLNESGTKVLQNYLSTRLGRVKSYHGIRRTKRKAPTTIIMGKIKKQSKN